VDKLVCVFGGHILPSEQDQYRGFAQISLYWKTRQRHSKRNWEFGIALCRREIQRCFQL